jgi:hypothetical protein
MGKEHGRPVPAPALVATVEPTPSKPRKTQTTKKKPTAKEPPASSTKIIVLAAILLSVGELRFIAAELEACWALMRTASMHFESEDPATVSCAHRYALTARVSIRDSGTAIFRQMIMKKYHLHSDGKQNADIG